MNEQLFKKVLKIEKLSEIIKVGDFEYDTDDVDITKGVWKRFASIKSKIDIDKPTKQNFKILNKAFEDFEGIHVIFVDQKHEKADEEWKKMDAKKRANAKSLGFLGAYDDNTYDKNWIGYIYICVSKYFFWQMLAWPRKVAYMIQDTIEHEYIHDRQSLAANNDAADNQFKTYDPDRTETKEEFEYYYSNITEIDAYQIQAQKQILRYNSKILPLKQEEQFNTNKTWATNPTSQILYKARKTSREFNQYYNVVNGYFKLIFEDFGQAKKKNNSKGIEEAKKKAQLAYKTWRTYIDHVNQFQKALLQRKIKRIK